MGPFPRDELPASSNGLAPHGKSSALSVGQSKSLPTELFLEDSVFLTEEFDDRILMTGDPASQGGKEDLPGLKDDGHSRTIPIPQGNRQLSAGGETA